MSDDLDPLDPDLARLLDAERDRADPHADVRQRVLERVTATLVPPPVPPGDGSPSPGPELAGLLKSPAGWVLLAVGAAVGAGAHATLAPAPAVSVQLVTVSVPVAASAPPAATPAETASPAPSATPTATSGNRGAPRAADDSASRDLALRDENALIARAQSALARKQATLALAALAEHQRRFPTGQLVEERNLLMTQARALAARQGDGGAP